MLLSNDRVRLRALEPEDLELLYRWENDPELWEVGNTLAPYSRYILKEYIAGSDRSIYESRQLRFMIEECDTGTSVGIVDLFDFEPHPNRAACGIMLDRIGDDEQLIFTTHNTDMLDLNLPKNSYVFLRKHLEEGVYQVSAVSASDVLKRNTDSLRCAVENDVFDSLPQDSLLNELEMGY